jgi:hypothetical protein
MTQVKICLIGKTREAVEEVRRHLEETASMQGQQLTCQRGLTEWRLDATLVLPAPSQLSTSGYDGQPVLVEGLDWPAGPIYTHARNYLVRGGVSTVEKLLSMPEEQVLSLRNMGPKGVQAIVDCLKQHGLYSSSALAKTWPD